MQLEWRKSMHFVLVSPHGAGIGLPFFLSGRLDVNFLVVHQNFPGQFRHVVHMLASHGHKVVALYQDEAFTPPGVEGIAYSLGRGNAADVHPLAQEFESKVLRGEAAAREALALRARGFVPDVILVHPGWGEALYLKNVFPESRMICLMEYFYRASGQDMGFDPEFPAPSFEDAARLQAKNANLLLAMEAMEAGVAATHWQAQTLPAWARERVRVIHEGIDTREVCPNAQASVVLPDRGVRLAAGDEVLTFVARDLEPVRGYHTFMRALPRIMAARPKVHVFIVGGDGTSYGARPASGSYKLRFLTEVAAHLDPQRVHFMGRVPRNVFLNLMQVSRCHVYLTYPFVLSWSMLEAMSAGALVVGSDTEPVREVIEDGVNGLLVDFFDHHTLADRVIEVLAEPQRFDALRERGRQTIVERYDLETICLPAYLRLFGCA